MTCPPAFARWTTFAEKYVLSLFFFFLAYREVTILRTRVPLLNEQSALALGSGGLFAVTVKHVLILALELFLGASLLFNRAPVRQPERLRDIVAPLVGTFFNYTFAFIDWAPAALKTNLMPTAFRNAAAVVALLVSVTGYAVAAWAVMYLGRSFSLLVSVRSVVHRGPYRWVRHPMYLGYILLFTGILLAAPYPIVVLLVAVYLALTLYRARLEEDALRRHSAEYREYARHTGFLVPRLRSTK
jgi:protein-S-isoprenylcysteine O-methyltransferase Ste14